MRNFAKIWPLLAFMVFLAGCQPVDSLNPLYTDKDLIFDPALLGKWTEEKGTLEFVKAQHKDREYRVVFRDDETPSHQMEFQGRLVDLQGHRFLDLEQTEPAVWEESYWLDTKQTKDGPRVSPQFVHAGDGVFLEFERGDTRRTSELTLQVRVAHWFFKVTGSDTDLRLDSIDDERLEKLLQQKKTQITHVMAGNKHESGGELLLTAETAELQRFVVGHVNDDEVFSVSRTFTRAK